ncbi:GH39 family glycosyl hydrolase [Pengzhenrongella sicca]|uniref:Xylan 1,4-beta-xylosidase n=1 Tax=Pengzhenrongella sicca TaxID=2819238 RepID=A0A8A4ZIE8_9MICO|nr:xylan 1,4-beta-xylosidase [Pengzhenrongella sicca]QTE29388.1 xylan 1,4-beta-xylosidase [Pengzhenrongella sicca]
MSTVVPSVPIGELTDAWRQCVGTGRVELALRSDYRDSLAIVQEQIGFRYLRGHGLFDDKMGVHRPVQVDGTRQVHHNFTYVDQVIDSWLSLGIKPFLELGFMPAGLASGTQTVFWWLGNVTPPSSYPEWAALVAATLRHLIDRYGADEVRTWPIEVWNEPNLTDFWENADQAEYLHLYEVTARTVKDVDAGLQVGGPAISPGADHWWAPFAEFVASRDVPIDFVSRHAYSSGPTQHIPFGVYQTLTAPQGLLDQFAAPRAHLAGTGLEHLPVHITEFNTSYNPTNPIHDTAYNAAYLAPVLAGGGDLVDSFSYWTFADVFEEVGVPTSFFHGGFGLLTHRGIPKPTFHLYAFMARAGRHILARGADHLVTRHDDGRIVVLAWQPLGGSDDGPYGSAPAHHELSLDLPTGQATGDAVAIVRRSVDEDDGNAWTAWRDLGRPHQPSLHQLDLLRAAAVPALHHQRMTVGDGGRVRLDVRLNRHEVTLIELLPAAAGEHPSLDDSRLLGQGQWAESGV